ncbi:hypothetical protein ElyMa_005615700 [Elysia marginata]|uniref:Uncharacterized protein n=1 Tax=Elysia marginata TaxID=1093978 RepID=A0AAV4F8D7_9GAST|nr:hypothetical protein ElyMa_005615700 [Elysia marginata]
MPMYESIGAERQRDGTGRSAVPVAASFKSHPGPILKLPQRYRRQKCGRGLGVFPAKKQTCIVGGMMLTRANQKMTQTCRAVLCRTYGFKHRSNRLRYRSFSAYFVPLPCRCCAYGFPASGRS